MGAVVQIGGTMTEFKNDMVELIGLSTQLKEIAIAARMGGRLTARDLVILQTISREITNLIERDAANENC